MFVHSGEFVVFLSENELLPINHMLRTLLFYWEKESLTTVYSETEKQQHVYVLITVIYKKRNETKSIKTTYIFSPK